MRTGYLCLQTRRDRPDLVRVLAAERLPSATPPDQTSGVRYIARFNDLDAAKMHFHNEQRRRLIDVDTGLYRVGLVEAMATVEAIDLPHQRVWIDPTLSATDLRQMAARTEKHRQRHHRLEMIWRTVGAIAVLWLVFQALAGIYKAPGF